MPKAASAVIIGDRPPMAGGIEGTRPLASSDEEIAHAGSNCSMRRARSVTSVNVPTSTIDTRSINR